MGSGRPRRLRVLTLIDSFARFGGAERLAATLAMRLDPDRFDRFFCATRKMPGPTFEEELRAHGVAVLALERRSTAELAAWAPLVELLRRERIDILHAHKFGATLWGAVLGRIARVPVVIGHQHAGFYEGRAARAAADRWVVAPLTDAFLTVSEEARRQMVEHERIDPMKVRVVANGIAALGAGSATKVRSELGIAPGAPVIGTVSQLRREKALDVLIEATGVLRTEFPDLTVLIAGRGDDAERVTALVREAGLEQSVRLLGPRTDVPDVLAALDVAVCCSDFEGTPLSVLEYMAAGKPIVATRVGGIPAVIRDGEEGLLVARRDRDALAAAVARLLRDPQARSDLGRRAAARQRESFSIDVTARQVELLYEELFRAGANGR